jgi:hypothetical protein
MTPRILMIPKHPRRDGEVKEHLCGMAQGPLPECDGHQVLVEASAVRAEPH